MKKIAITLAAVLMATTLAACGAGEGSGSNGGSEDSKKLVVYSPNSEGLMDATIPLFEEKYDIEVEVIQAGTGELIKRLQSEKQDPYADVMFGGSFSQFVSNGDLFEEYVSPNDKNILEAYRNTTGFTTSYVLDGSVLIVNKDLIGDIEIKGYADLLNPALKGKIATADPANSSSAFAQLTNMLKAMGGYESDEAWKYVEELFINIDSKIQSGSSAVYKSVADGEMVVGLTYEDPSAGLVRDGANVEVVYPEEGTVFLPATAAIVKDAKNMENAKLFIDFIISEEVQNIYGTTLTNRPVLIGAETGDYLTDIEDIYVIEEDMEYVNENKSDIVEKYTDIFTSIASK